MNNDLVKLKYLCKIYTGNSIPDTEKDHFTGKTIPYIPTKSIDVSNHNVDYDNGLSVDINDGFKIAPKNSTILCIEGGSAGKKIAFVDRKVAFVNKLCCFDSKLENKKYLFYALQSFDFVSAFNLHLGGLIGGVSVSELKNLKICMHKSDVQTVIVATLDRKISQIDKLIANQEKQIEKLNEYKQSIITKAVTKGLDPNVEMKDSGVEWIGKIPVKWSTIKIKFTSWLKGRIGWDGLKSTEFIDDGPYLITGTDFANGEINWSTCAHISEARYDEDELLHIKENDLLITKDGTIGKLAIVRNCPEKVSLNSGVMIIRSLNVFDYLDKYLYYILQSNQFYIWYELSQSGNSTIKHLYQGQFYNFEFSFPEISEQNDIALYLDKKCNEIDSLINLKNKKIEKLQEYKKSLIYEYVTGKKQVV